MVNNIPSVSLPIYQVKNDNPMVFFLIPNYAKFLNMHIGYLNFLFCTILLLSFAVFLASVFTVWSY